MEGEHDEQQLQILIGSKLIESGEVAVAIEQLSETLRLAPKNSKIHCDCS